MASTLLAALRRVHCDQPLTRQALSEGLGLSPNRISVLVGELLARGLLVEEAAPLRATADRVQGRPPTLLSTNANLGCVVGLDIGGLHSRAALADFNGNVLASAVAPTEAVNDRTVILRNIVTLVQAVCEKGRRRPDQLLGLGVGVRAIVDTGRGLVLSWPNTPIWSASWTDMDLPGELGPRLGVGRVVVDDSVRMMGLAAHRFGPARGAGDFLYVFLGSGIGSAVFVNGRPYAGRRGMAGEVGHVAIDEDGPWCVCGNRGCLEATASTAAVMQRLKERLAAAGAMSALHAAYAAGELTLDKLLQAAHDGDKLAFQVLSETGRNVGRVLAIALNLLDPDLVVLGGPLTADSGVLLDSVRHQVRTRALPHIAKAVRIVCDDQGDLAGARGAALLVLDAIFDSDAALEALLAQPAA